MSQSESAFATRIVCDDFSACVFCFCDFLVCFVRIRSFGQTPRHRRDSKKRTPRHAARMTTHSRAASNSRMRARTKVGISRFFVFSLNARWGLCASWVL